MRAERKIGRRSRMKQHGQFLKTEIQEALRKKGDFTCSAFNWLKTWNFQE
ncbi:hypothetical protein BCBMB205_04100 [Bacillus sp. CN2]|nr:hypothetical protein BCBMB205_04100 [Bacillus velezensis]GFR56350.1 hypothetical protein BCBMB205_04100 [Bacillus sp. CN2]